MESYLVISFLNDFIFCPRSIYFHNLYGSVDKSMYHSDKQTKGLIAHKTIDTNKYTTSKDIYMGIDIYSHTYGLCGKIDIFDTKKHKLIERKRKITTIYDGYIFQIYAQYFCLIDMEYDVKQLVLYSLIDNKSYNVSLPKDDKVMFDKFKQLLIDIKEFTLKDDFTQNINKCKKCIYNLLCDTYKGN